MTQTCAFFSASSRLAQAVPLSWGTFGTSPVDSVHVMCSLLQKHVRIFRASLVLLSIHLLHIPVNVGIGEGGVGSGLDATVDDGAAIEAGTC